MVRLETEKPQQRLSNVGLLYKFNCVDKKDKLILF